MSSPHRLIYIHGLDSSGQGVKATLLREIFPDILTPDFSGSLAERMQKLNQILEDEAGWVLIGSSFGGLMAAVFTCQRPHQVEKQILLAPALIWPDFAAAPPPPVSVPTRIIHGRRDEIVPLELVRRLAGQVFLNLVFQEVDDDHGLFKTVHALDWPALLIDSGEKFL